jgi:predicted enzyme related to lactoylglutathione lyase
MIQINEIAFSWYPVADMARARSFYEGVLGLKPGMTIGEPGGMQWSEYEIGNGTLALGCGAPDWRPRADGCSVGLEVDDFDGAIEHLRGCNVSFWKEPFETPVCRMAFVLDPDGNAVCIHKRSSDTHSAS